MKISTKGRYALRVMVDLAINDTGEFIPLKNVSSRQEITIKYLEQIIPLLSRAGYLKSSRGKDGGYRLAKPARDYKVGDILRTVEGSLSPVACMDDDPNKCPRSGWCSTLPVWTGLNKVINEYLDDITLEDLAENNRSLIGLDYSI
ncbi:MAG: Rrf2 family transcriptional regulator [Synergistaceae bacterium]|jgi:Rrf2 family protein|nr:Rrf2 family transcriptional regulator [Synergistaceae bacterium]